MGQKAVATVTIPEVWSNDETDFTEDKEKATKLLKQRIEEQMTVKNITSVVYKGAIWVTYFLVKEL